MSHKIDLVLLKTNLDLLRYKLDETVYDKIDNFISKGNNSIREFINKDAFCNILISANSWFTYCLVINIISEYLKTSIENTRYFINKKNLISREYYSSARLDIELKDFEIFKIFVENDKNNDLFVLGEPVQAEFNKYLSDKGDFYELFDKILTKEYLKTNEFFKIEIYQLLSSFISYKGMVKQDKLKILTNPAMIDISVWKGRYDIYAKWIIQLFHNISNGLKFDYAILQSMFVIYYDIIGKKEWLQYIEKCQDKELAKIGIFKYIVIQNSYNWISNLKNANLTTLIDSFIESIEEVKVSNIDIILAQSNPT